ncbi:MFS transporter [Nonomuraea longispora]|uniref:MFS transporter n=1 Tax=Nonomuraea longispora TaxID=1848320 RepID=A0A4R4NG86_9ACTN|nr:MFS transporter [Nonomuraea longispora]TDC08258.1 MFS transporter [Nonomuraea longispora]
MIVEVPAGRATRTRRPMAALCSGTALMNAAMAVASVAGTLVAGDRLGTGWAGVPATAGIIGTGAGALVLTRLTNRAGRRAALVTGYVMAAAGACLAVAGVVAGDMIGLTAGMALLGLGNAGAQLSRYAAAELHPAHRRGFAIGVVVWAAAFGAVGGPLLLDASGDTATGMGLTSRSGPFLLASLACAVAALASVAAPARAASAAAPRMSLRRLARTPAARSALVVMVAAQVVMVAVMTAAPLEMHLHGDGLGAVGLTLSAHTLGMFALSPVTGRLFDRFGARPVMLAGLLLLVVSAGSAAFPPVRPVALFLLGYAWNLCFVAGSGHLARDLPEVERPHVEGAVDAAVWTVAAGAGLLSTVIMSAGGYGALTATACAVAVLATFAQARLRGSR